MPSIMICGTNSGCGKTTATCGIISAFLKRQMNVQAFKCGPDYIDPMFHRRVSGISACNLDSVFCDDKTLKYIYEKHSASKDISIIEGVMGYYDGVSGKGSSCDIARRLDVPVIIVVNCKGISTSIGAIVKGFLTYQEHNNIVGFIFNMLPDSLVNEVESICKELNTEYLGRIPKCEDIIIESRHLGLVTADEIKDLQSKLDKLAILVKENINLDRIYTLSQNAVTQSTTAIAIDNIGENITIAVAKDNAFCFMYDENIALLRDMGCRIEYFSPLYDDKLPQNASAIILSGGYPELYAKELSCNSLLASEIKAKIESGIPTIAECGGYMYLMKQLEGCDGKMYDMVGVIDTVARRYSKLRRFGYMEMSANESTVICDKNDKVLTHEYHYFDCDDKGEGFLSKKISNGFIENCGYISDSLYASYGHLYFYSNLAIPKKFIESAIKYNEQNR